jgi:hypothetical protein
MNRKHGIGAVTSYPPPCVEHLFGNVLHREFPMHVAKVREWKRRYGGRVVR